MRYRKTGLKQHDAENVATKISCEEKKKKEKNKNVNNELGKRTVGLESIVRKYETRGNLSLKQNQRLVGYKTLGRQAGKFKTDSQKPEINQNLMLK